MNSMFSPVKKLSWKIPKYALFGTVSLVCIYVIALSSTDSQLITPPGCTATNSIILSSQITKDNKYSTLFFFRIE